MENRLQKVENKEEKKESIFGEMKDLAMISFIEGLLPKLEPFIGPATDKLEEYFGNDTKIFSISRRENQATKVIVLDNTKGHYSICNYIPNYTPEKIEGTDRLETPQEVESRLIREVTESHLKSLDAKIKRIKSKSVNRVAEFSAATDAVINVHDTRVFIQKLLSGEFTKQ